MNQLGEYGWGRNVEPERSPATRRHTGFFLQFPLGANLRPLAGIEFSRGNLPQKVIDAVAILTHHAYPIRAVHRNHGGGARTAHVIVVVLAAVRVAQPLGRYLDDAAAVSRNSGHDAGFLHELLPKNRRIRGMIAESRATV